MKHLFVIFLTLYITQLTFAQDSRHVVGRISQDRIIKLTPEQHERVLKAFNNHPYTKYYDRLIVEYEKRMKSNVRKYEIMARKMKKPQYSDISYFGHKRKPKKRPGGKMKFCRECQMIH